MCQTFSFTLKMNALNMKQVVTVEGKHKVGGNSFWQEETIWPLCLILLAIRKTVFWQRSFAMSVFK